jgi:hypothetical protein
MVALPPRAGRRRARRGSVERPVNARMYRGTWLLVGVPLLVAAFSVARPQALPPPPLPPTFDPNAALALTKDLAGTYPDRSPGSLSAFSASRWVGDRLQAYGFRPQVQAFEADIPGYGTTELRNLVAVAPGRSRDVIVVMAHRDNAGTGPGANDNASGTGALIELARAYAREPASDSGPDQRVEPAHTLVFLSTDGGAFGGIGAAHFARDRAYRDRIVAVVNLDAVAGRGRPRLVITGDRPRSPAVTLVRTAAARLREQTGVEPARTSGFRQLVDLGFPFSLSEQAPFVALGIPAVTLTTSGDRPSNAFADTSARLAPLRLAQIGSAAQAMVGSLDQGLELSTGRAPYLYLGSRIIRGWAIQLVLVAMLLPFLAATVDLFARCRRRKIALAPALRAYRSRLAVWLFGGLLFYAFDLFGAWPDGVARPLAPSVDSVRNWPLLTLAVLVVLFLLGWLVARERLLPRRRISGEEVLAGYTAGLLALAVAGLLVVATNAFALIFLLPSVHAWLWLPQVRARTVWFRVSVLLAGLAGPLLFLAFFASRYGLGLDAPWYLATLASAGYVEAPAVLLLAAWAAATAQFVALAAGRYAPYPSAAERPPRGPVREIVRRTVLAVRRRRRLRVIEAPPEAAEA